MATVLEALPAAGEEARAAARWYRQRNPIAAAAFEVEVRRAFGEISKSPDARPVHVEGTRRFLLRRFPYEVVYRIYPDRVLIVAVAHCKRKPGYWSDRVG